MILPDWAPLEKDVVPEDPGRDPGQDGFPRSIVRGGPVGKRLQRGPSQERGLVGCRGGMRGASKVWPQPEPWEPERAHGITWLCPRGNEPDL